MNTLLQTTILLLAVFSFSATAAVFICSVSVTAVAKALLRVLH